MTPSPEITKAGKFGYFLTVSQKRDGKNVVVHRENHEEPILPDTPIPGPLANVGLSIMVGMSTPDYHAKIELGCWCTLPCAPTEAAIEATYSQVAEIVTVEADRRLHNAIQKFFPELADK